MRATTPPLGRAVAAVLLSLRHIRRNSLGPTAGVLRQRAPQGRATCRSLAGQVESQTFCYEFVKRRRIARESYETSFQNWVHPAIPGKSGVIDWAAAADTTDTTLKPLPDSMRRLDPLRRGPMIGVSARTSQLPEGGLATVGRIDATTTDVSPMTRRIVAFTSLGFVPGSMRQLIVACAISAAHSQRGRLEGASPRRSCGAARCKTPTAPRVALRQRCPAPPARSPHAFRRTRWDHPRATPSAQST